jgi:hypothetical protein
MGEDASDSSPDIVKDRVFTKRGNLNFDSIYFKLTRPPQTLTPAPAKKISSSQPGTKPRDRPQRTQ